MPWIVVIHIRCLLSFFELTEEVELDGVKFVMHGFSRIGEVKTKFEDSIFKFSLLIMAMPETDCLVAIENELN